MRIAMCVWRMATGGAERQMTYIADGLVRRGVDVHVVTAFAAENDTAIAATGAVVHRLPRRAKYDPRAIWSIRGVLRHIAPDLVHTWLTQMDIVAGIAAKTLRLPWVLSERSAADAYPRSVLNTIRALVGESADAVIANSQGGADYWRHVVRRRGDVRVIGNAVPVDRITSAQSVGTSEGIAVDEAVILYVGRFSAEKNLQTLLRALARVLRRPATRAVFCGDGPLRDEIERLATDLGIRDRTAFLGSVSNVWSWMKRADVLVTVSRFEGNPNVVLEAAAAGLPIVASEIPAHRAVLLQDTARFVDANSSEHIAVAIEAVLSQPEEARGRAAKARRLVERRSEVEVAAEYETAYRAVLERAGKPEVA